MFRISLRRAPVAIGVAAVAVTVGGVAMAAVSSAPASAPANLAANTSRMSPAAVKPGNYVISGCITGPQRILEHATVKPLTSCPGGGRGVAFNSTGPRGPQGPSGVMSTATDDLKGVASVATGGGFVANATEVGTGVQLKAGTYLVSLNAKATPPSGGTGNVQVYPQFFVYDQAKNSDFSGDLLNVGSGALESGPNANIDSYYSGSSVITVPAGGKTIHVYAFGYDSDRGSASYILDDLTITATAINAG